MGKSECGHGAGDADRESYKIYYVNYEIEMIEMARTRPLLDIPRACCSLNRFFPVLI